MLWYEKEKKVQKGNMYKSIRLAAKALVVGQPTVGNNMGQCAIVCVKSVLWQYSPPLDGLVPKLNK